MYVYISILADSPQIVSLCNHHTTILIIISDYTKHISKISIIRSFPFVWCDFS